MSKMILAAMMAFGISAFANDTKPAETTTTPAAEATTGAPGTEMAAPAAEGKKMAKAKGEKHMKKTEKKEHGGH